MIEKSVQFMVGFLTCDVSLFEKIHVYVFLLSLLTGEKVVTITENRRFLFCFRNFLIFLTLNWHFVHISLFFILINQNLQIDKLK